ncbi:type II toxin-antitoxin system mRNA interferase toxin, RelE/StbE family [Paraburkholderia sacchari]|uniref:type II toxin-antitoxin system RelE/ParE family toxin n=1 Tax=Paraburkholderia sacchari TaxID=159450 RepID=UPI0005431A26|nr:type II toxin-antitoxin system mRNA interferase toxin, RelE/StbE family [Paraburkholderia sacchari]NLP61736.1 type II toxin-antitoxin system mRNA interferase toxin, RelE/StbE family [Paraburkholderia sacchari]
MRLEWSPLALADREAIFSFTEARSSRTAVVTDERIAASVRRLRLFPEIGRVGRMAGTRELVVQGAPLIVIYRIERHTMIKVLRVLHSSRRWPAVAG